LLPHTAHTDSYTFPTRRSSDLATTLTGHQTRDLRLVMRAPLPLALLRDLLLRNSHLASVVSPASDRAARPTARPAHSPRTRTISPSARRRTAGRNPDTTPGRPRTPGP